MGNYGPTDRRRIKKRREMLDKIKDVPCTDCGQRYIPYVMDFDHVRGTKRFRLSSARMYSVGTLLEEARKCDVVCANCHRVRTYVRRLANEQ